MQRLLIAVLTIVVFGAGYAARMWNEHESPVPPPPASLGAEFSHALTPPKAGEAKDPQRATRDQPIDRAKLVSDIEHVRPQVESYRKQLEAIDAEYNQGLIAILTAEQRGKYADQQKKFADRRAKGEARDAANALPLSDEQIYRLQYQRPLYSVLNYLATTPRLEGMTRDLMLASDQQDKLRDLLRVRRDKFIVLVDSSPPPTITLQRLVPVIQKLAPEKK